MSLVSPFEGISAFDLLITIDGVKLDLATVARRLRQQADTTFSLAFEGSKMTMQGRAKLRQLEPSDKTRKAIFEEEVRGNNGSNYCETPSGFGRLSILSCGGIVGGMVYGFSSNCGIGGSG